MLEKYTIRNLLLLPYCFLFASDEEQFVWSPTRSAYADGDDLWNTSI